MDIIKKKVSALPLADSLVGLHTLGVDANNQSVKVSLEFVKTAADNANEAAENAEGIAESVEEAEDSRVSAETARVNAESTRVSNEDTRVSNETTRSNSESSRVTDENARVSAESGRSNAEGLRVTAESGRVSAEGLRVSAETARQTNTATAITNANTATTNANNAAANINNVMINYYLKTEINAMLALEPAYLKYIYKSRITTDSGTLKDENRTLRYLKEYDYYDMLNTLRFAWFGEAGIKTRTSGVNQYVTKAYNLKGTNDAVQATELNQPNLSGNIAPNEKLALQNANGQDKFLTHSSIAYTGADAWSVTSVLNTNWNNLADVIRRQVYCTNSAAPFGGLMLNEYTKIAAFSDDSTNFPFNSSNPLRLIGKNAIITITYSSPSLSLYVNGVHIQTVTCTNKAFTFSRFLSGGRVFNGKMHAHVIKDGAMSLSQVVNEHNFFRALYPEIRTVQIGAQQWATSNLDVACTPMGNLISNVTDNTAWGNSITTYNTVYAATSGTAAQKKTAALRAAAMWRYPNNDPVVGAIYAKKYNYYAIQLIAEDIAAWNTANPSALWGYDVPTRAQLTTLSAIGGNAAKVANTDIWPSGTATNSSGLSALAGGIIQTDGTTAGVQNTEWFGSKDSNYVRIINDEDNSFDEHEEDPRTGVSLRLIKV